MNARVSMYDVYAVDVHTNKEESWQECCPEGYAAIRFQDVNGDHTLVLEFDAVKKLKKALSSAALESASDNTIS